MIEPWEIGRRPSADPDFRIGQEFVRRQREIQRSRTLPDATGGVVDRAVAGAEVAVVWSLMRDRDAAEVGADADQDGPLVMTGLDPRRVRLRVGQLGDVDVLGILDLLLGAVI